MTRLPVLTYHSLDDSDSAISVSPALFRRQMEYLQRNDWKTLSLYGLLGGHARGEWPAKTVLLTFDDGFKNFLGFGLPALVESGFAAMIFVVAGRVGNDNDWPGRPRWVPRLKLMDWEDLRSIAEAGMEIGAHSLTHPHLFGSPVEQARREIVESRTGIQDRISHSVDAFAYPYGETSYALEEIVRGEFRAGFSARLGLVGPEQRSSCFSRVDAYYLKDPRLFHALGSGRLDLYLSLRRLFKRMRPAMN